MMYEFKVADLAEEFGVHRNTIRNWINSGTLPAQKGAGKRYTIKVADYVALCDKLSIIPKVRMDTNVEAEEVNPISKAEQPLQVIHLDESINTLYSDPAWGDVCLSCGTCASACPLAGVNGLDPRKIVRMAVLGLEKELVASDWPWKCTMCGKCEETCPMNIQIVQLMRRLRSRRPRNLVPSPIRQGVAMCLEKGNNLGIPKDDFAFLLRDLAEELAEDECPGFAIPLEVRASRLLVTVNSKEPFTEPDDMKWWWKIFYAANESWTISAENWEGANWGLFSGDDESMKTIVGRIVDNLKRLQCEALLLPECGHAYYATRYGLTRWFPETLKKIKIYSIFDLLIEYMRDNRISIDKTLHTQLTTYHDPCNYGRKSLQTFGRAYFEEGRIITRACCPSFVDMEPNRNSNYCCGAGGGSWALPYAPERVFYGRIKARQIQESGAQLVIAPCHNCRDQLKKSLNKEFNLGIEVKYLWELVADSLILPKKKQ